MGLYNQGGNLIGGSVDISATEPTGRVNGSLWIDSSNNRLYQLISGTYTQIYPITSAGITDLAIVNGDVSASAAIAYSKLNLATSIVNADVSTSAAIAVNKLAALTASRAVETDASGFLTSSAAGRLHTVVIKTADETIQSDTALSNDSTLTFSVAASTNYFAIFTIFVSSGATPDFQYALTVPAGGGGVRSNGAFSSITPGATGTITDTTIAQTDGSTQVLLILAYITIAGTAGSVTFQWAQNTSDASNTTVKAGSNLLVFKA